MQRWPKSPLIVALEVRSAGVRNQNISLVVKGAVAPWEAAEALELLAVCKCPLLSCLSTSGTRSVFKLQNVICLVSLNEALWYLYPLKRQVFKEE